jgi:hypothetical protein
MQRNQASALAALGLTLALAFPVTCAEQATGQQETPPAADTVVLSDGQALKGTVISESETQVVIQVAGVPRTLSRSRITSVAYGDQQAASEVLAPDPIKAQPDAAGDNFTAKLAADYHIPESAVLWVRRQGFDNAETTRVVAVAARVGVPVAQVAQLRLQGLSWREIRRHYGLPVAPRFEMAVVAPLVLPPPPPLNVLLRLLLLPLRIFRR